MVDPPESVDEHFSLAGGVGVQDALYAIAPVLAHFPQLCVWADEQGMVLFTKFAAADAGRYESLSRVHRAAGSRWKPPIDGFGDKVVSDCCRGAARAFNEHARAACHFVTT